MNKSILSIFIYLFIILGIIVGRIYNLKDENQDKNLVENYDKKLVQCLENELGGYIVTEKDKLVNIPLSEINNSIKEKIAYFKGVFASEHSDSTYMIVYPKNGTYDYDVMKFFDKYFYEKFSIYQKGEISSITVYINNQKNDVNFNEIINKCKTVNNNDGRFIPTKTIDKLNDTKKIIIKYNQNELGTIKDKNILTEIIHAVSQSKQYGNNFLCDSYAFNFEMYDSNNKLIDTIYVWDDGRRLIPASIQGDCSYYSVSNDIDLRKIIEKETNYIFYNILDFRNKDTKKLQWIYKDSKYNYYLNSENDNEILIQFMLNNQIMTLKYAIENKYISAEKVANDYPNILITKLQK